MLKLDAIGVVGLPSTLRSLFAEENCIFPAATVDNPQAVSEPRELVAITGIAITEHHANAVIVHVRSHANRRDEELCWPWFRAYQVRGPLVQELLGAETVGRHDPNALAPLNALMFILLHPV